MIIELLTAACLAGPVADRSCSPGQTFPRVTAAQVCERGWAGRHRHVTLPQRHRIFARYRIPYARHASYELDHLVPLELGGSNADTNLWPELWVGARVKDRDENRLHAEVCAGRRTLRSAQRWILRRWSR